MGYPDLSIGNDLEYHTATGAAKYSTADLNRGLICMSDSRPGAGGFTKCMSSEAYDGRIRSWSELQDEMNWAATINPAFPESARRGVWFQNPSWHFVGDVWDTSRTWNYAPDFKPASVADVWIANLTASLGRPLTELEKQDVRNDVAAGATPALDGVTGVNPNQQTKVYVRDPQTGVLIDTTEISDPNVPVTSDGRTINQLVYGDRAPEAQPAIVPSTVPATGLDDDDFVTTKPVVNVATNTLGAPPPVAQPAAASNSSASSGPPWWVYAGVGLALIVALKGKS